ncbi:MAG: adenylyltransferase/cytidyltransferase family protein [Patescibacteria group bacterium]|nr:adenylyltransferase/cytidyltransferase family protein [Patescibacteria group bacterium]
MKKTLPLIHLCKVANRLKQRGKTVGLVTGKFDILHTGHLEIFEYARKRADFLIVGIDNDKTIRITKGKDPLFDQKERITLISELENVDFNFIFAKIFKYNSYEADKAHQELLSELSPSFVITNENTDKFLERRRQRTEKLGIKLLIQKTKKRKSSSEVRKKL